MGYTVDFMDARTLLPQLCECLRPFIGLSDSYSPVLPNAELILFAQKRHRIGAMVASILLDNGDVGNSDLNERLSIIKTRNEQAYLRQKAAEKKMLKLFADNNIQATVLKGAPLAEQLYENPSIRSSKDIDFLVCPDDADRAIDVLVSNGMEPSRPRLKSLRKAYMHITKDLTFFEPQHGQYMELHKRLLLAEPDGFTSALINSLDGKNIPGIGNSFYALYLIMHGASANWPRLKWIIDVAFLLKKMSGEQVNEILILSDKYYCKNAVAASLQLAEYLFSGILDESLQFKLSRRGTTRKQEKLFQGFLYMLHRREPNAIRTGFPFAERYVFDGGIDNMSYIPARIARPFVTRL